MNKKEKYETLLENTTHLIDVKVDIIANMANISALLYEQLKPHWVGFYRVIDNHLILGPFAGPVACTRIAFGKGVCGRSWQDKKTIIVDNVHEYPGHIACSPFSNSEIVIPCFRRDEVYAVLDIDSSEFSAFDETDKYYLEKLIALL